MLFKNITASLRPAGCGKKLCALLLAAALTACAQLPASPAASASTPASPAAGSEAASASSSALPPASSAAAPEAEAPPEAADSSTLVVYFSWSGNTEEMARYIAERTGGDLLELVPETPYPTDYGETGDIAKAERDTNARPAIAQLPDSLDGYDTLLVGYPIWWHTAPMIIGTFLESYDLRGVTVYPFTQSASMDEGQFQQSMGFIRETAGAAAVQDGLFAPSTDTGAIDAYLAANGLL